MHLNPDVRNAEIDELCSGTWVDQVEGERDLCSVLSCCGESVIVRDLNRTLDSDRVVVNIFSEQTLD